MKRLGILMGIAGVGLGVALVVVLGAGKIWHALLSVGWGGFALIVGWQFVVFVILATAWHIMCPGGRWLTLVWGRLVREGGTNILPFSEAGGLAFGARAVALGGVPAARSIASSLADVAAEFIGEIPFILFGVIILVTRDPHGSLLLPIGLGAGLLTAACAALIWAEHHLAMIFKAIGRRIANRWARRAQKQADEVQRDFEEVFNAPRRIAAAAGLHFTGWLGGGVTVWLCYRLLGGHIGLMPCMAIEALLSAALAVAFLVPAGLGVQEVAYIAIGRLFGMPAHLSLGLSLLRRARDIVIGAPALASWQVAEARQLRRTKEQPAE